MKQQEFQLIEAIKRLQIHDHLCLIYEKREEQFAAVIPFIRIGIERGEKCVYIADDNTASDVMDAMRADGIDVDSSIKSGALSIITKKDAYLRNGYFDPDMMIKFLKENIEAAKTEGYKALRASGEMTWALGDEIGVERLLEYEAKLNYLFPGNDIVAICQYNRSRFSPDVILDVIHTHPLVIYGAIVCKNMYYIPPDEFLTSDKSLYEVERLLRNIIERTSAEEALRESEEKYRTIFEESFDGLFITSRDGKILDINRKGVKMFGYDTKEEMQRLDLARDVYDDPLDRKRVLEMVNAQRSTEYEVVVKKKNGEKMTTYCALTAARDENGVITSYRGIIRDITEHKRA
ncbi:MAG: MEDS domain-containing protein, partial [Nitrospirota bacterium]